MNVNVITVEFNYGTVVRTGTCVQLDTDKVVKNTITHRYNRRIQRMTILFSSIND